MSAQPDDPLIALESISARSDAATLERCTRAGEYSSSS